MAGPILSDTPRTAFAPAAGQMSRRQQTRVPKARKIRLQDLPVFTRQLGAMLSSGMPVVQSLVALEDQTTNPHFKQVIAGLRAQIEAGSMFSEALTRYPDVFDDLYVGIVRAGESGGMLAETVERIAVFLEASAKLRRKVKSAMMYPVIVMVLATLLAAGMITFIVPVFSGIYADFGAELPLPTQILVNISNFLRSNLLFAIGIVAVLIFAIRRIKKTPQGAYMWDKLRLRLPVFGELSRKVAISRFSSTFAQLMRSGVPILRAIEIVADATGNLVLGRVLLSARAVVERGEPLSSALVQSPEYPRVLVHMLAAGEKTGKVEDMLQKIAEFYDDEVEATLSGLTSLIEPLLIVFLGVIIGSIVVCMFLPIFKMHEIVNF